ncbi:hypothetical protein ACH6EH_10555 [Paenibacillus sp. JSM ZJ436]|uniref:hypothetical protein n=1 Tax=Paenibacillus sp. JSM ZJ436 TaxID=3376190 RepID=UPI0037AB2C3B
MNEPGSAGTPGTSRRLGLIQKPSHPLCREDIMWVLHYAHKKVTSLDPAAQELTKSQLLQSYSGYCRAVLLLMDSRGAIHTCSEEIRACLADILNGLNTESWS